MKKEKTADLAVMADAADAVAVAEAGSADAGSAQGKCTRRLVPIADRNARCLSSRQKAGPFTAGTATKSTRSSRLRFRKPELTNASISIFILLP